MTKPQCNNCQKCCWIWTGVGLAPCPYAKDGKCSIYDHRLGTEIAPGQICGLRKDTKNDYAGCPYNTGKPVIR